MGRTGERRELDIVLDGARSGQSGALVLVGEAGIGKTALLDYAVESAADMQLLRARGIESESDIPFASLLELLRPALVLLDKIPTPQSAALAGALALRPATAQERFAIGAATLSLLAAKAEQGPLAVVIDDAHWLDASSAQALLFALRRLVADPIAVLIAVRGGEASPFGGIDLPVLELGGLSSDESVRLLGDVPRVVAQRLHAATAGNPLALLELAGDARDLELAPEGAPVPVSARVSNVFLERLRPLEDDAKAAVLLAATSDTGDLPTLERAAAALGIDPGGLAAAEAVGLLALRPGWVEFRHPLARSAIYANASAEQRREAHRALAAALPDGEVDRRAWHLAAAAVGSDESASAELEQVGARAWDRSAYAAAAAAFERGARLTAQPERRARLLTEAGEAAWLAGFAERALALLDEARSSTSDPTRTVAIDHLTGYIVTRTGPVMRGHDILIAAAERADPERAVAMLADAANACLYAGRPAEMLAAAARARAILPPDASTQARFLVAISFGMAQVVGGDAAAGAQAILEAIALADGSDELREDVRLLPWLAVGPIFLRHSGAGRSLLEHALTSVRERTALGALPFLLCLIARDEATTDRWAIAESTYREAIELARESAQLTDLGFGLMGLAWLQARRGRVEECRACVAETRALCVRLGTRMDEVWANAALGELELSLGDAGRAVEHFECQRLLLDELAITDVDISPAAELVDAYIRVGRLDDAAGVAAEFLSAAEAKAQPWSLARALRATGLLADDDTMAPYFERALVHHAETPDVFEEARTRLAFGERLRRARRRVLAREQLRAALVTFHRLGARAWADRAEGELAATGATARRRDVSTVDELTPQELQIGLLLGAGKTTREAAAALFLSPKTIEYHLGHVYIKLGIHSRAELTEALASRTSGADQLAAAVV